VTMPETSPAAVPPVVKWSVDAVVIMSTVARLDDGRAKVPQLCLGMLNIAALLRADRHAVSVSTPLGPDAV
jgi:hypothetical protein